jgi:hypothetical protein
MTLTENIIFCPAPKEEIEIISSECAVNIIRQSD